MDSVDSTLGNSSDRCLCNNCMTFVYLQERLDTLDLAGNRISKIENVSHLVNMEEFWVRTINHITKVTILCLLLPEIVFMFA